VGRDQLVDHQRTANGGRNRSPRGRGDFRSLARRQWGWRKRPQFARNRSVRFDDQNLGGAKSADEQAVAVDDDVAKIALEAKLAQRYAGVRGVADELAPRARDMDRVGRRVEGETAGVHAHGKAPQHGARGWVEHRDGPSSAQDNVQSATAVFDDATRFVAAPKRNRRHNRHRVDIDDDDLIVVRIRYRGAVPLADDGQRAARDGGRGLLGLDDRLGKDAGDLAASGASAAGSAESPRPGRAARGR
jgi:hypothetical protein